MVWLGERLPPVALVIAVIAATGLLGRQGYELYRIVSADHETSFSAAEISPPPAPAAAVNLSEMNLFGAANQAPTNVDTTNLPTTNLRLVLRGVSASVNEHNGNALIEGPDKDTDAYAVGDILPGNAKLKAVFVDRVVVDRSGRLENLLFPEEFENNSPLLMASHSDDGAEPDYSDSNADTSDTGTTVDSVYQEEVPPEPEQASDAQQFTTPIQPAQVDQLSDERKEQIKARLQELRDKLRQQY